MNYFLRAMTLSLVITGLLLSFATIAAEADAVGAATYDDKGELVLPHGFREWVFVGAPLTPHGLNNGKAGFPEYHHVYVNPDAYAVYKRTGRFPEGTVIAKELVLLQPGDYPDGSKNAPSGRGFFAGDPHGMDVMVKDSRRFSETNGWGFFNFGHHAPPYTGTAPAAAPENCAACHAANAGKGMVFRSYYPVLR